MAPKTVKNPRNTARFYRDNPKSRAKKNAAQRKLNKSPENKQYRAELFMSYEATGNVVEQDAHFMDILIG